MLRGAEPSQDSKAEEVLKADMAVAQVGKCVERSTHPGDKDYMEPMADIHIACFGMQGELVRMLDVVGAVAVVLGVEDSSAVLVLEALQVVIEQVVANTDPCMS